MGKKTKEFVTYWGPSIADWGDGPDQRFVIEGPQAGQRLDKLVVGLVPGLGRKGARRLFEEGRVRINGKRPNKGDVARQGDQVTIALPDEEIVNANGSMTLDPQTRAALQDLKGEFVVEWTDPEGTAWIFKFFVLDKLMFGGHQHFPPDEDLAAELDGAPLI